MIVTGTFIKNKIKIITSEIAVLNNVFEDSLYAFAGETKTPPKVVADTILRVERELGAWQAAQKHYNSSVVLEFEGRTITLQEAISIVGGYGRVSKLMKKAAGYEKRGRYDPGPKTTRTSSEITATKMISAADALTAYKEYETKAAQLRGLIGLKNNVETDIKWLDGAVI